MVDYQELIDKYNEPYVPGEKRSNEYERKVKREQRLKSRLIKLDLILNDAKTLLVTPSQKKQVQFLIKKHSNEFKELHRTVSEETIILAFIFYVKMMEDISVKIDRYTVSSKYNLTHNTFETIICRLAKQYIMKGIIPPEITTDYDHEIMLESKGKTK
ncbi:MAG: hypothetical protein IKF79_00550 [Methanosphaera sp.]|nr:hypothetical protein [Methanosphaera sp.]